MECTRMPESEACSAYLRTVSHPALIVFDLDGTIADSRELARESYKRVFALMGFGQITDELADSFNGPDADEVCRVMGIGKDRRALYDELVDQTDVELTRSMGRMFSGTSRMLSSLSDCATMAILTNGSQRYCEACIETFALSPYIALHSGFVSGVTKAQRIRQWQHELNAAVVIVVGDRATDIQNARAAGAYAVGVTYGMG
ncbi:MAG: HAD family hydrolase, partial [Christensenellales bacterium]